jgi:hypothetical protein
MRMLAVVVAGFAVLAFDLTSNNGRLLECVEGFAKAVQREAGF